MNPSESPGEPIRPCGPISSGNRKGEASSRVKTIGAKVKWLIPIAMVCPLACTPATTPPIAVAKATPIKIDEITLKRFGHRPGAPFYEVVLRRDGTITYTGQHNVTKLGTFEAKIGNRAFGRLEELFDQAHYFEIGGPSFGIDVDQVRVSAVRRGRRTTMEDGSGSNAPVELWSIEMAIDGLVAGVSDWKQVK